MAELDAVIARLERLEAENAALRRETGLITGVKQRAEQPRTDQGGGVG